MGEIDDEIRTLINQSFQKRFSIVSTFDETWHPLTDVYDTSKEIIVKMELPGVDVKDLQVILEDRRLIVQGVRRDDALKEKLSYQRMEINYGPFRRVIALPLSVKIHGAAATYQSGFLEIRLPFAEEHFTGSTVIDIE